MTAVFLEVVFNSNDLAAEGFVGRDELEDPLAEALAVLGLGEITGGGSGSGVTIIDVEIDDEAQFESALATIRESLQALKAPRSTVLKRHKPEALTLPLYER